MPGIAALAGDGIGPEIVADFRPERGALIPLRTVKD